MLLAKEAMIGDIRRGLAVLQSYVQPGGKLNLTDINVHAEDFVAGLLNTVFSWDLVNTNKKNANYPCIDLIDESRKLGVQVTSESGSEKLKDTLECLERHKLSDRVSQLKVLSLIIKQKRYKVKSKCPGIVFDWKVDVLDFTDLLQGALSLSDQQLGLVHRHVIDSMPTIFPKERPIATVPRKRFAFRSVLPGIVLCVFMSLWVATSPAEPPMARLPLGSRARPLARVKDAYAGCGNEFRTWEEMTSEDDRETLLVFSDHFARCPQQFVLRDPTNRSGIGFDLEIKRGLNSKQFILRDVVVEVTRFHTVAPTFFLGAALGKKPVITVEMWNRRSPLPWTFKAKWIAESKNEPLQDFEGTQTLVTREDWETFLLKLESKDRGIYEFNIDVLLQQDNGQPVSIRVTEQPLVVGFFLRPPDTHPDFKFLQDRYIARGGRFQQLFDLDNR